MQNLLSELFEVWELGRYIFSPRNNSNNELIPIKKNNINKPRPIINKNTANTNNKINPDSLKTYQIINSEGEYITIDTLNNNKFYGPTWNYLLANYVSKKTIRGTVSKKISFKNEPQKIAGFNVIIQAENSNHKINAFLPMRFANSQIKVNDIVICFVKEFDPEIKNRRYSLVLQLAQ